jgi:hypothetical protein
MGQKRNCSVTTFLRAPQGPGVCPHHGLVAIAQKSFVLSTIRACCAAIEAAAKELKTDAWRLIAVKRRPIS